MSEDRSAAFGPPARIPGMVRYTGELAQPALQLNRFLVWISLRENRAAYLADEEAAMERFGLQPHARALVRARDCAGLLAAGANVYAIAKSGHVFGLSLPEIGAQMRAAAGGAA